MFIGHLGADATSQFVNDQQVINFNAAVTKRYKTQSGEIKEKTTWIGCSYWTKSEKLLDYLKKGTQIFIEGEISAKAYVNQQNQTMASLQVTVREIQLIGAKKPDQQTTATSTSAPIDANQITEPLDDLPF